MSLSTDGCFSSVKQVKAGKKYLSNFVSLILRPINVQIRKPNAASIFSGGE